ncbi:MAG: queuosine precursor transporter [Bacteroidetes bacterium]|nr:queuosine precursor transporter [Bacteroidota bacterium]
MPQGPVSHSPTLALCPLKNDYYCLKFIHVSILSHKPTRLYLGLGFFFLTNAIVAEFMGVKIFSLEQSLGISPFTFRLFGEQIEGFSLTCGILLWPFVFVMTDIINEYYGTRGVRFLSLLGAFMIGYAFLMLTLGMNVAPAPWWISSSDFGTALHYENAYDAVFGQGANIIVGSILAFVLGQWVDVYVFHFIKRQTGERYIWLRSTGSTIISQFIDTFVVLFYAFYISKMGQPNQWKIQLVLAVGLVGYLYKFVVALLLTPVIYAVHAFIERYLGHEVAAKMKQEALGR